MFVVNSKPLDIAGAPFHNGDLVRLTSGDLVVYQDAIHPPTLGASCWHFHPQDDAGNSTASAMWVCADYSVASRDEMIIADEGNIRVWRGGLVAPEEGLGTVDSPKGESIVEYLATLSAYRVYRSAPPSYRMHIAKNGAPDPKGVNWSGEKPVPALGETITVTHSEIGKATIRGFFVENGWLGLLVVPVKPPRWYVKQNGADAECHVFGTEMKS